jgi:calcium/calmodulin-dependent protein kinase I
MCGTPNYMAPEIYNSRIVGYNYICDMWSVGVVVYCLLGGYLPFEGSSLKDLTAKVISGEYYFHDEYWKSISPSAKKMILGLLQTDPRQRLTAEQALSCTWMGMDDEELSVMDLSATQSKLGVLATGKEKVKTVAIAVSHGWLWVSTLRNVSSAHTYYHLLFR